MHQNPWISRILQSWGLGFWLSKVFQTKDQKGVALQVEYTARNIAGFSHITVVRL